MNDLFETLKPGSEEWILAKNLDPARLPRHIAVIMDGNGRWAKQRHMPRIAGHKAGVNSVREIVESSARLGIEALTLYAFSTENWKRPTLEVQALWQLLRLYLRSELSTLRENNVRLTAIGRIEELPAYVQTELAHVTSLTAGNTGLQLNLALNYSGRTELVDAVRGIIASGVPADAIDEELIERHLYTNGLPEPDLLIRTSGEMRVSNFLLWQIAYSELVVSATLWPDFRCRHLLEALMEYQRRERRFGGVGEAVTTSKEPDSVPVGVASR
ncbi:MAG: isoprenyl transferase [Acidobacteria bacterium]|nr:isoprenyl transferase [Acidobacteriota bacterium]